MVECLSNWSFIRCGNPQGFENGGANIVAIHPLGDVYQWFNISLPFTEKNNGEEISVGDSWMNMGEGAATNAVIINTTQSGIFVGMNI